MTSMEEVFATEWKQIEKEITCSVCDEIFNEPKTLPCLHTFCKKCIRSCVEMATGINKAGKSTCPLCRLPFLKDGLASLPTNFVINSLIEIFDSKRKRDKEIQCDECEDDATACTWCVECEKGLCQECHKAHKRMKSFKTHKTFTMDEFMHSPKAILTANPKSQCCIEHEGQLLDLYCMTCAQLICRDCTYVDHPRGEHQFDFLKKVVESKRTEIKKAAAPLTSLMDRVQVAITNAELSKQEVDATCANNCEEIRSVFKDLRLILDAQEAKMLQNVDAIKNASYNVLDGQKSDLQSLQKQLNNYNTSVTGMTRSSSIDELLVYLGWVDQRIADLTSLVDQANLDPVYKCDSVVWPPDLNEFTSYCGQLFHVAGAPYVPNCDVKVETKSNAISVILKDACGYSVINQAKSIKIKSKGAEELDYHFQVKEHTQGQYCISCCTKSWQRISINVTWNDTILNKEDIVLPIVRDYRAVKKEAMIIKEYGSTSFSNPWHMANGPNDELLVCDYNNHRVVVFNKELQYSHSIGSQGKGNGKFQSPSGVAVDNVGHLYIADEGNGCIQKFNINGSFICQFATRGSFNGQLNSPHGLAMTRTGQLYVCDRGNHRIQVFQNHKFVLSFGRQGSNSGEFNMPSSVAFNNCETQLFVADTHNHRVQLFNSNGQFVSVFGKHIWTCYKLDYPYSIFFTRDCHLLVTSQLSNVVMVFKEDGTFLSAIEGNETFVRPAGVIIRPNGQIVVSGWYSYKLAVFQ